VLTTDRERQPLLPEKSLLDASFEPVPPDVEELFAEHLPLLRILGARTAELHIALAHDRAHPRFAPQRYTALSRRSFYQSLRNSSARAFDKLAKADLPPRLTGLADGVRKRSSQIRERLDRVLSSELGGFVIRVHGDFHLGQVLYTGRDFYVIDFEGEPARARAERERLRSPMADVAGMLRSFHYAALGVLSGELSGSRVREEDRPALTPWATFHQRWSSITFLSAYLPPVVASGLLPSSRPELALLLEVHLLEKALYELSYELDSRPHWVELPLQGLLDVLNT
jgi:maltose alpha-D-glucosyltransferase/alpha-amylase